MQKVFGLPIDSLAFVLTVLVGLSVAVIAALAIRNRVFLRLGVRNVGRRRGRSVLIVVGLMLATAIIASALGTGDTMGRTVRSGVLQSLGTTDESVEVRSAKNMKLPVAATATTGSQLFDARVVADVDRALRGTHLVDGITPAIVDTIAVQDTTSRHTEPRVGIYAPDPARMTGFDPIVLNGKAVSLADLAPGTVYLDRNAESKLHARTGDHIMALAGGRVIDATVAGIVDARGTGTDGPALLMPLASAQRALGIEGKVKQILVSNRGGEATGVGTTDAVVRRLDPVLAPLGLQAQPVKKDGLKAADDAGNAFMQMFTTFGSFSIAAGILLIFLIFVMLAAERRTEMGVARAIGTRRGHLVQTFLYEGAVYDLVAAAIGALLGVGVSLAMVTGVGRAFAGTSSAVQIVYSIRWQSIVVAYMIGVLLTLLVVALSAWRVSIVSIVTAIRNLPDPKRRPRPGRAIAWSSVLVLFGALLAMSGRAGAQMAVFMLGVSLVVIGAVGLLRVAHVPDRAAYTAGGLALVVWWLLPFRVLDTFVPGGTWDFTVWVVGGLIVVVGATWTVIYNADILLGGVTRLLGRIRSLAGVAKISMAYPLRTRLRTGMTLAMFTLVVFTLVVGTTTTSAFLNAFNHVDKFGGGFDVQATTSPLSPVPDLGAALQHTAGIDGTQVRAVGNQSYVPVEVRQSGDAKYTAYPIRGLDDGFLRTTTYELADRAYGYATDGAVWDAVRTHNALAVVDANIVPHRRNWNFGALTDLRLHGLYAEDGTFAPISLDVRDPETGRVMKVTVIGVLRDSAPYSMAGVSVSQGTLAPFGTRAVPTAHYVQLAKGVDAQRFADRLESAFLANGMQADSFKKIVGDNVAASLMMDRLVLGFMGLGLVVGVAALGVIAARSVVERRQQIGVLRAIGFQASAVRLGFLLESGFLAATSILVGTTLGLLMSFNVIDDATRQGNFGTVSFAVPWLSLAVIFTIVLVVALATTYIPARKASRVYAAEALRYQ